MSQQDTTGVLMLASDEGWASFVNSVPSANIFHHPAWMNLLAECYGYRPFVVAVRDGEGEIIAGLPVMDVRSALTGRRWVSLPFTDHCSPLCRGDAPPGKLFEYVSELRFKHDVPRVEVRCAVPCDGQVHKDDSQVLHLLRLSNDPRGVFRSFHRNQVRRNIARAEREGVKVRWAEDQHGLQTFYDLHVKTRHRLGVPVQPRRYFELLWQRIIDPGHGFILLAYRDCTPIAGAVFVTYKTTLVYKYGASDSDYWRFRPNHSLFWTAIRWGCEHGYALFDWGKTSKRNIGLRNFKSCWGAQESDLTYSVFSAASPSPLADRLSGITGAFIRHTPMWVCRMTGELLYRHFA